MSLIVYVYIATCMTYTYILGLSSDSVSSEQKGEKDWKTATSKGQMHSNDHIKENWATIEGGAPPPPPLALPPYPLGESLVGV